ncbi:hypothetical protein BDZ89DRAFT_1063622 [Hymenopellis radicata]|nr:hypothetical protein BDZ89DRAFT_1063622 [Hymenopellis radicata]
MSSRGPSLPPELVDTIVQYLSNDKAALRSCTLVSGTWSSFSQRTLFLNTRLRLSSCLIMAKLLHELLSVPRLRTLICRVVIDQPNEKILKSSDINFLDMQSNNGALQSYLDFIRIPGSSLLIELDLEFIGTIEDFHVAFEALEGTNIKRVTLYGDFSSGTPTDVGAAVKRLHLPSLECICLAGSADLPNLKQCEIILGDFVEDWRDVLLRGFPPLKLFKFEITTDYMHSFQVCEELQEDAFCPLPLAGLHFEHVHLSIECIYDHSESLRLFMEWWLSTFRALCDSKATIHFTELTFTFIDPENDALKAAWHSLDDILSHPVFSTVRSIHFEESDHHILITQAVYPALADKVRLALPRLASRGVLCFV